MLFNSFSFLLFFPIVALIYFLLPNIKSRNIFLLTASYYFYMNWQPVYALLLMSSTLITYICALAESKYDNHKKLIVTFGIVINIGILFFFKYYNFAAENITLLLTYLHIHIKIPNFNILLPVGISFYIFQAIGYMIDVYRKDIEPERNLFTYALFVSFFPQLVAGPIERSTNLLVQFYQKHKFDADRAISGVTLMLWGYFLKLVVADRCALYVDSVFNNLPNHNGSSVALAAFLFCFQLYGDFAGYSYIAIGCSNIMGFKLMDNFKRPYFFSVSVQDFWKRNHISLTTWFMDYIYYPLVGSSTRLLWWCLAIFITFFISGFWHGADWTYVISFSIFGIYLVVCTLKDKRQRKFEKRYQLKNKEWWLWLNRASTFILVAFALLFFRANNVKDAFSATTKLFSDFNASPFIDGAVLAFSFFAIAIVFLVEYSIEYNKIKLNQKNQFLIYTLSSALLLIFILNLGVFNGGQFIYFQF